MDIILEMKTSVLKDIVIESFIYSKFLMENKPNKPEQKINPFEAFFNSKKGEQK